MKNTPAGARHRVFIPTTVADTCILGAAVVPAADTETLPQGYQGFQAEAPATPRRLCAANGQYRGLEPHASRMENPLSIPSPWWCVASMRSWPSKPKSYPI